MACPSSPISGNCGTAMGSCQKALTSGINAWQKICLDQRLKTISARQTQIITAILTATLFGILRLPARRPYFTITILLRAQLLNGINSQHTSCLVTWSSFSWLGNALAYRRYIAQFFMFRPAGRRYSVVSYFVLPRLSVYIRRDYRSRSCINYTCMQTPHSVPTHYH